MDEAIKKDLPRIDRLAGRNNQYARIGRGGVGVWIYGVKTCITIARNVAIIRGGKTMFFKTLRFVREGIYGYKKYGNEVMGEAYKLSAENIVLRRRIKELEEENLALCHSLIKMSAVNKTIESVFTSHYNKN